MAPRFIAKHDALFLYCDRRHDSVITSGMGPTPLLLTIRLRSERISFPRYGDQIFTMMVHLLLSGAEGNEPLRPGEIAQSLARSSIDRLR